MYEGPQRVSTELQLQSSVSCVSTVDMCESQSAFKREQETRISTKKKICFMCNRFILHQGRSGTYLSQQGEACEG